MFSNAFLYVLNPDFKFDHNLINEKLTESRYEGIGKMQQLSTGFVQPVKGVDDYAYELHGSILIKLHIEKRVIKSSVLNRLISNKCEQFEKEEGYIPSRKIRMQMKEDITAELLPSIHPEPSSITAHFDKKRGWLVVHASSGTLADEFTACLREALGSLPIVMPNIMSPLLDKLSQLSTDDFKLDAITLGEKCKFKDADGAVLTINGLSLYDDLVRDIIGYSYNLSEVQLTFQDSITVTINDSEQVKSIRLSDDVTKGAFIEVEDPTAQFDADMILYCQHYGLLMEHLISLTGKNVNDMADGAFN